MILILVSLLIFIITGILIMVFDSDKVIAGMIVVIIGLAMIALIAANTL